MTLYTTCGNEAEHPHDKGAAKRLHDLCSGRAYDSLTQQLVACPCPGHVRVAWPVHRWIYYRDLFDRCETCGDLRPCIEQEVKHD